MTDETRRPLFARCAKCEEIWKIAMLPAAIKDLANITNCCPNCFDKKEIFVCTTEGPGTVTEPREGMPPGFEGTVSKWLDAMGEK